MRRQRIARRIARRRHLVVGVAPRHVLVHEEAPRLAGEHDELLLARAPRVVRRRHALHHRREDGVAVDGAPRLVRLDERPELQVGEDVAGHEDEVGLDPAARLDLAQRVARRVARRVRLEHAQHHRRQPLLQLRLADVPLDLVGVRVAEDEDLLHAAGREELERVLNHRQIGERH